MNTANENDMREKSKRIITLIHANNHLLSFMTIAENSVCILSMAVGLKFMWKGILLHVYQFETRLTLTTAIETEL